MRKLFKNKRDRMVFAAMSVVFLLLLVGFMNARSFERDWYNWYTYRRGGPLHSNVNVHFQKAESAGG
ncbi:MAG: hypothetical protein IJM55_01285 [Ruminococcus sp.]|nr:hypothetical protein [Ruminococcus sp.]